MKTPKTRSAEQPNTTKKSATDNFFSLLLKSNTPTDIVADDKTNSAGHT